MLIGKVIDQLKWDIKRRVVDPRAVDIDLIKDCAEFTLSDEEFMQFCENRLAFAVYQSSSW